MPRKPLYNELDGMLGYPAWQQPFSKANLLVHMGDALMPLNMPSEAHCKVDRGINAVTGCENLPKKYLFKFSIQRINYNLFIIDGKKI
jgi:hypothetical protein